MTKPVERMQIPAASKDAAAILRACLSPASFWSPEQVGPQIAWLEHAPFAFWLVEALRPNLIVELGTHGGFSYFSLCQAVQSLHLDSRCYAVDTWKGDEHAGFYGEEVFRQVEDHNRQHYSAFSTLIRSTFDEALPHFSDGSIDLLHIDGRHTFKDVKHDFSTWQPKLSERAVVLFHDTNVRERNFGVSKLWEKLCHSFPHFEFLHGNGLGVLGVGEHLPNQIRTLFSLTDNAEAATNIRNGYARLGSAVTLQFMANQLNPIIDQQKKELVQWSVNAAALREDIASRTAEGTRLAEQIATQSNELVRLRENITLRIAEETRLREQTATQSNELARLRDALDRRTAQISKLEQQLQETHSNLDRMLAEHTRQLEAFQQALAERSKELGALQQALVERNARVTGLDHELAERGKELGALQQALIERDARVTGLDHELAERGKEFGALQQALVERDSRVTRLDHQLAERGKELGALQQALSGRDARVSALNRRLSERNRQVSTLRSSTSWRITAPLRLAKRIVRSRTLSGLVPMLRHRACARVIARSGLFDGAWYLQSNPDVEASGVDPIMHYVLHGAREGRDPSASFSTRGYLLEHPQVAAAGVNPFEHFIRQSARGIRAEDSNGSSSPHPGGQTVSHLTARQREDASEDKGGPDLGRYSGEALAADCKLLRESGLFDLEWYRARAGIDADVDAIEHYLVEGWRAGLEPNAGLEGTFLYSYFSSAGRHAPPAITFLQLRAAGAPVYATAADAEQWAAVIRNSDLFDAADYASRAGLRQGLDPALHYLLIGEHLGHAPSDGFDPVYYRERYPDTRGISPLWHYLTASASEGRRAISVAADLVFDRSRLDPSRETVLVISHEATRTGAPIVAYNVAKRLSQRYNIVILFRAGGELVQDFQHVSASVVGPFTVADRDPIEVNYITKRLLAEYSISYAIVNSIECRQFISPLANAFVPVVSLIHEFASCTHPKGAMGEGLDWSTQIVFSTNLTKDSAVNEQPHLSNRAAIHVLPQGRCDIPRGTAKTEGPSAEVLRKILRPKGYEDALVVLGAGFVHIRKGVDLFLSSAAAVMALRPKRPVRFIWIGHGYDVENDPNYSSYLAEQIDRSELEGNVAIIGAIEDLEPAYQMSDIFFLSSRLDPLPNVTIDAAFHGLPVVCFEKASGMAALLAVESALRPCVVPHLDVQAAARVITNFANDEGARKRIGQATRQFAEATFDMDRYVNRLEELGREAAAIMRQRERDFITLRDDPLFDENILLQSGSTIATRQEAIRHFLAKWVAVGTSRRPCAGFHPHIYVDENSDRYDTAVVNPLAHFIRSGKPNGPWRHEVIIPGGERPVKVSGLRTGLHGHFHYPELATDFLHKLSCNHSPCDLMLSTDTEAKASLLHSVTADYQRGKVLIRVVPNRGRNIGPFLTAFNDIFSAYDLVGHLHGKRSPFDLTLGEAWREFLWQNLLGNLHPMMDIIFDRFATDSGLGLVFAEDPHLNDWDDNREIAKGLAERMEIKAPLPPSFEFPNGAMFWCRPVALKPLFSLRLAWNDYPEEPVPYDGTILHAIERLLPLVVHNAGYRYATTHIRGVTR